MIRSNSRKQNEWKQSLMHPKKWILLYPAGYVNIAISSTATDPPVCRAPGVVGGRRKHNQSQTSSKKLPVSMLSLGRIMERPMSSSRKEETRKLRNLLSKICPTHTQARRSTRPAWIHHQEQSGTHAWAFREVLYRKSLKRYVWFISWKQTLLTMTIRWVPSSNHWRKYSKIIFQLHVVMYLHF